MDFSFLSQPAQLQLPDPTAMAVRGQTLANLTQQNQENQYKLDAMKQAQEVKIAAGKVFGDAQTMGWDAAIRKAAQEGNNLGAAAALQLRRDDEGAAAKVDNDRAQAEERRSLALKNTTGAKAEAFKTFAPLVTGLASGQVPVNDQTQSAVYESARALLPENVVRTMPSDPAQMANWAKQFADPTVLNTLWKDSQEVPAKVGLDNANANRANVEAQYIPQDSQTRRIAANAQSQVAGTGANRLKFDQEQANNPNYQHATDANGNPVAFNVRNGEFKPAQDANGNLLPMGGKLTDKQKGEVADLRAEGAAVDDAIKAVKATPSAFGFVRGIATNSGQMAESLAGRADSSAERAARSLVFNNVSSVIKQRAGTAQSAQELQRINAFLPGNNDSADQIVDKFNAYKQYIASREGAYSQPVTAGSGPAKAAPEAATAAPKVGTAFSSMPDPQSLPVGSVVNYDGTRYKNTGKGWERI